MEASAFCNTDDLGTGEEMAWGAVVFPQLLVGKGGWLGKGS